MVGTSVPVPGILSHDISFHTHLPGLSIVLGFNLQHRMGRWSQEGSVRHVGGSLRASHRDREPPVHLVLGLQPTIGSPTTPLDSKSRPMGTQGRG